MTTSTQTEWFADHANLVLLTAHLADTGHTARTIAYAVEKPWKYEDEFRAARAIVDHEVATGHRCLHDTAAAWYCNDCDWTFDAEQVSA